MTCRLSRRDPEALRSSLNKAGIVLGAYAAFCIAFRLLIVPAIWKDGQFSFNTAIALAGPAHYLAFRGVPAEFHLFVFPSLLFLALATSATVLTSLWAKVLCGIAAAIVWVLSGMWFMTFWA